MAFEADYNNAERTLLFSNEDKLPNGVPLLTIVQSFCLARIGDGSYYETLSIYGFNPEAPGFRTHAQFVRFQLHEKDTPKTYNGEKVTPVFELHDEV